MSILRNGAAFAVAMSIIAQTHAKAADAVGETPVAQIIPQHDGWVFSVAPYFWAAGVEGDVGLFGLQPVNIDMSFDTIFDNLRFGGMIVGEAHNGSWGVLADVIYIETEAEQQVERTVAGTPLQLSGNIRTSSFTGTVMGQYRALSRPSASLDLMAGARIWSVDNDIELSLTTGGSPLAGFSGSDGSTWVDPMIGLKGRFDLTPDWYLTGWGMIGGFGAGSDITWDVLGGVGYQWTNWVSVVGGYRAIGVDYEDDGFVYDVVQQGPIFGAVFRF